jgi:hypothetical protein
MQRSMVRASRLVSAVQRGASSCLSWLCWPHEPGEPDREAGPERARFRWATPPMSGHPGACGSESRTALVRPQGPGVLSECPFMRAAPEEDSEGGQGPGRVAGVVAERGRRG